MSSVEEEMKQDFPSENLKHATCRHGEGQAALAKKCGPERGAECLASTSSFTKNTKLNCTILSKSLNLE